MSSNCGHPHDHLSDKAGLRRFGLVVGVFLLALAGVIRYWRHSLYVPLGMAVAGLLLLAAVVLIPAALAPVRKAWMTLAAVLGWINTRILLVIVFYLVVTPTALLLRLFRRDPMQRRWRDPAIPSYWARRTDRPFDREDLRRQF